MKKFFLHYLKIFGLLVVYFLIFVYSVFFTMKVLIKGEELSAPDFVGKSFTEAENIAIKNRVYLKKIEGIYDKSLGVNTIITQVPSPGVRIKEKSIIKVFLPSEVVSVVVPNLAGLSLSDCERLLRENDLIKRYISYMDSAEVPVDVVIGQSYPSGAQVPRGTEVDLLASRGSREQSYIMPDLIGKKADEVQIAFDRFGLKIAIPALISYPGVGPGIVLKQYPLSGFPINTKARINIEVSK
jgi:eukaryotic-like serine/threonine-protein kinase